MKSYRQNSILFLVSFIILFLEIALIRWVSTEVRIFAYLSNFVLLASFLGIGLGCYLSQRKTYLLLSPLMVALLVFFIKAPLNITVQGQSLHFFTNIPIFLASFEDTVIHYQRTTAFLPLMQIVGVMATLVLFFTVFLSLFPLGQVLGRIFDSHSNTIKAYSINIFASLLGVWAFNGLSFLYAPPWVWLLCSVMLTALLMVLMKEVSWKNILATVLSCVVILGGLFLPALREKSEVLTVWSPYQKLSMYPLKPYPEQVDPFKSRSAVGYTIYVNNVGYMHMHNLSSFFRRNFPSYFEKHNIYKGEAEGWNSPFNLPFLVKRDAKTALILGSGGGTDVAGALRNGLEEIDAVEIDPGIYRMGLKYHPENPYSDPRVRVFVDDARSFIKKCDKTYDLIYYGLLDAHAQASSMNNMRMDHYVYTKESFREAKALLKKDGLFVVGFWVPRIWIGQRIENLIK